MYKVNHDLSLSFLFHSSRGSHLCVWRHGVQEWRDLPEQLQIPVYLSGWSCRLCPSLLHGHQAAQPRLPHAQTSQSAREVLRGVGVWFSLHTQFHGLSLTWYVCLLFCIIIQFFLVLIRKWPAIKNVFLIQCLLLCLQPTERKRPMAQILPWWERTAWSKLLNGVPAQRPVALGSPPGSPMITVNAALRNRPDCVWCDPVSHSWSRALGWVFVKLHCFHHQLYRQYNKST